MESQIIKAATEIIQPVLESAMLVAGHYSKACNRGTITGEDVRYGMMYAARNCVGKHIGTLFPEDSDSDCSSIEEVDEEDEPFTRYSGDDKMMNDVNEAFDTWTSWVPQSPMETLLKDSIDNTY